MTSLAEITRNAQQRGEEALRLRDSGLSWRKVGAHLGVCGTRAKQMAVKSVALSKMAQDSGLTDVRVRNCLINEYLDENPDADPSTWVNGLPPDAKKFARGRPDWEWLHVPNFGMKSLKILREWAGFHKEPPRESYPAYPAVGGYRDGQMTRDPHMYRLEEISFDSQDSGKLTFKVYVYAELSFEEALRLVFGGHAARKRACRLHRIGTFRPSPALNPSFP